MQRSDRKGFGTWAVLDSTATDCDDVGLGLEIVTGFSETLEVSVLEALPSDNQSGTVGSQYVFKQSRCTTLGFHLDPFWMQ